MTHAFPFPLSTIPLNGEFGNNAPFRNGHPHRGVDFSALRGAKGNIHAVIGGIVVINQWSDLLGWVVEIRDANGMFWGNAHMAAQSLRKVGEKVADQQILGVVGDTGSASIAEHLHLTLGKAKGAIFSGTVQDPIAYIQKKMLEEKVTTTRTVGATRAKLRVNPSTVQPEVGLLDVGSTHEVFGWIHGESVTQNGITSDTWFQMGKPTADHPNGLWSWAPAFTDASTAGLIDLNPVIPPPDADASPAEIAAAVKLALAPEFANLNSKLDAIFAKVSTLPTEFVVAGTVKPKP